MISADETSGDRWIRNYPNAIVFSLLGGMAAVILLAILFFTVAKPHPGAPTKPSTSAQDQPAKTSQP